MKFPAIASVATLMALAAAAPAAAQRGPSLTLYEAPGYQGPARSFGAGIDNLANQGFNDRAMSARVQGRWRLCEDSRMRGRCVEVTGDVPNLAALRLNLAVSSFELLDAGFPGRPGGPGGGFPGGGPGGGRPDGGRSLEGRTASFFPDPGGQWRNADAFCRTMGFRGVIYADENRGGRLADVLCRR